MCISHDCYDHVKVSKSEAKSPTVVMSGNGTLESVTCRQKSAVSYRSGLQPVTQLSEVQLELFIEPAEAQPPTAGLRRR
eukprot:g6886.t1